MPVFSFALLISNIGIFLFIPQPSFLNYATAFSLSLSLSYFDF